MSYEVTEQDKEWTTNTLNKLKIKGFWMCSYYTTQRTKEKSLKIIAIDHDNEQAIKMLGALIMVCKAIGWDIEHSDVFCCERGRYCELYHHNDGVCCPETDGYDLPGEAGRMCPACSEDYLSGMADDAHDRAKDEMLNQSLKKELKEFNRKCI